MTYEQNYLAHYGVPGQKWGVRRYQYENGTLTAAGKERYGKADQDAKGVSKSKGSKPESKTWKPSDASNLSDEELNRRNSRLQREQQYRQMTENSTKREIKSTLKEAAKKIFIGTAVSLAAVAMKNNYSKIVDTFLKTVGKKKVSKAGPPSWLAD